MLDGAIDRPRDSPEPVARCPAAENIAWIQRRQRIDVVPVEEVAILALHQIERGQRSDAALRASWRPEASRNHAPQARRQTRARCWSEKSAAPLRPAQGQLRIVGRQPVRLLIHREVVKKTPCQARSLIQIIRDRASPSCPARSLNRRAIHPQQEVAARASTAPKPAVGTRRCQW